MNINRRDFLIGAGAVGTAALGGCKLPGYCGLGESVYGGIPIGVITFSYWHMPVGYLSCLKYVKDSGLSFVELMGYDLEVDAGAPIWKLPWDQTADEQAERAAWPLPNDGAGGGASCRARRLFRPVSSGAVGRL